jgi:hypothetical protein
VTEPQTAAEPQLDEMGPIDYLLIEWPNRQPDGEAAPYLMDLADRGIIRILDIALMAKDEDGTVGALDLGTDPAFAELVGASSGLLDEGDLQEAAAALNPGSAAAVLVFENRWAAPFASAVRRNGGQLVASGRIPVQAVLASLDAIEQGTN